MKKLNRVGEKYTSNGGDIFEIFEYVNCGNVAVKFEDGSILRNVRVDNIKRGRIRKPFNRLGKEYANNLGLHLKIIEYVDASNCTVQFDSGTIIKNIEYGAIKKGHVTDPFYLSLCGVGFLGQGSYIAKVGGVCCKAYRVWNSMLNRCYSKNQANRHPSYKDCIVAKEWHNFQNFAKWHEENYNVETMQGRWDLDKDIIIKGNKIYSSETCCFVPQEINKLFVKCDKVRGNLPVGVYKNKNNNNFVARISKNKGREHIGVFNTPEDAFKAYKVKKELYVKEVAEKWRNKIDDRVYQILSNYEVNIND
jgi:hypothetical protein